MVRREAPTRTIEQAAASLVDQARRLQEQGIDSIIPVWAIIRHHAPILNPRYKTPGLSGNYDLMDAVVKQLETNHEIPTVNFRTNQGEEIEYDYSVSSSQKYAGILTVSQQAWIREATQRRNVASLFSIAVWKNPSLTEINKQEFSDKFLK